MEMQKETPTLSTHRTCRGGKGSALGRGLDAGAAVAGRGGLNANGGTMGIGGRGGSGGTGSSSSRALLVLGLLE